MAIRGNTKNIAQSAQSAKELDPVETLVPFHIDLKNGHLTPALNWERRPGLFLQWTLTPAAVVTPPVVPPQPPTDTEVCPDDPSVSHVDTGFTNITIQSAAIDQTNAVVYYGGTDGATDFITKFDLDPHQFLLESKGNGFNWNVPWVDPDGSGDLYVSDASSLFGFPTGISQINPTTFARIRTSGIITNLRVANMLITTANIFCMFSSPTINSIFCIQKSDLTLRWSTTTAGTTLGVGNRLSGYAVDGSGNLWVHTHQSGTGTYRNALIKLDATTGAGTLYDLTLHPSGTFLNLGFDTTNNVLIISGNDGIFTKFNLTTFVETEFTALQSYALDPVMSLNGMVDAKFWIIQGTTLNEYDIATGLIQRSVPINTIDGQTVNGWTGVVMVSSLNCLHLNHGAFTAHPFGGVDRLCLPCP